MRLTRWVSRSLFVVCAVVPAFVFMLGGIAKLDDPFLAAQFMARALGMPLDAAFDLARGVAALEVCGACGACLFIGRSRLPAYAGMCLLCFFMGLLVTVALSDPQAATCGCFGGLMGRFLMKSLWTQVAIDFGLLVLLGAHLLLFSTSRGLASERGSASTVGSMSP